MARIIRLSWFQNNLFHMACQLSGSGSQRCEERGRSQWEGAPWEPQAGAGEGGRRRRRGWEPRAGPSDCSGLQAASARLQPRHILMHLLRTHGWGWGDRHPRPHPHSALGGGSLSLGGVTFQIRILWLHPQGLWCWIPFSFSCPQVPLTWSRVSGGLRASPPPGTLTLRAALLEERSHRAPKTQRWQGQHQLWPQTEPDGPQLCPL